MKVERGPSTKGRMRNMELVCFRFMFLNCAETLCRRASIMGCMPTVNPCSGACFAAAPLADQFLQLALFGRWISQEGVGSRYRVQ